MGLFYKRMKHFKFQINQPKFVFDIVKDLIIIRHTLKKSILSTDIFPSSRWSSIEEETKREIFSDYRDYNLINEFYTELKQRDSDFSQKDISDQILRKNNEYCFRLADYTLGKICWLKYHTISHKKFISLLVLHLSYLVHSLYFSYLKFSELSSFFLFKAYLNHIILSTIFLLHY
jgi:hypothetical protein